MVLNTRNFILYLLSVALLLIAIATTASVRSSEVRSAPTEFVPAPTEISNEATVIGAFKPDRAHRLSLMKEKVAAHTSQTAEPEDRLPDRVLATVDEEVSASTTLSLGVKGEQRCGAYEPYTGVWQTTGLSFKVVEGARLLSRVTELGEESILQLPLRTFPLPMKSCLSTDVVAIALDGSLIRNTETALYSIFTEETLLGYTIDGFTLYGLTDRATDECGGAVVEGQYRYYLTAGSPQVLNCFAGIPIDLSVTD